MGKNGPSKKKRDLWKGLTKPRNEQDLQYLRDSPNPNYRKQWVTPEPEPVGQESLGEKEEMADDLSGNNGVDNANADEVSSGYHCLDNRLSYH